MISPIKKPERKSRSVFKVLSLSFFYILITFGFLSQEIAAFCKTLNKTIKICGTDITANDLILVN